MPPYCYSQFYTLVSASPKNNRIKMDKILIGIVTYEGKNYCFKQFSHFLRSITYPNIDIVFVDNSFTPENKNSLIKQGFNAVWLRKGKTDKEIMANCNEWLREYALQYHFSHLLSLESDIIPCPNFLEFMLSYEKPVIGLPYFIGQSFLSYLLEFDRETSGYNRQLIPMSNAKSFFQYNGKLKRSQQIGLGCLLMHKSVLKRVKFVIQPELSAYHADSSLHMQLQQLSIPVYLCPDYICEHENKVYNRIFTESDVNNSEGYKDYNDN